MYRMSLRSFSVSAEAYSISAVTFSSDRVEDGGNEGIKFILIALHCIILYYNIFSFFFIVLYYILIILYHIILYYIVSISLFDHLLCRRFIIT